MERSTRSSSGWARTGAAALALARRGLRVLGLERSGAGMG